MVFSILNTLKGIYIVSIRPFDNQLKNNLEVMNELTICLLSLMLPVFTELVHDADLKYNFGWVFIGIFILNLLINTVFIVIEHVRTSYIKIRNIIRKCKRKYTKN